MSIICAGCGHELDYHTPHGCSFYGCNCERKKKHSIDSDHYQRIAAHHAKENENGNVA